MHVESTLHGFKCGISGNCTKPRDVHVHCLDKAARVYTATPNVCLFAAFTPFIISHHLRASVSGRGDAASPCRFVTSGELKQLFPSAVPKV